MSKKRDLYNMDEFDEAYNEEEDPGYYEGDGYGDPSGYVDEEAMEAEEEAYPEMPRGGYMDEEFDYETEQNPAYQDEEEDPDYYNLYNPNFQKFLLKNGIIKFDSSSSDDSDDSDDSDSEKSRKKTSRKKSTKKKSTKRKRK